MQCNMWPVDVICLSSSDGDIRPLRIRAKEGMEETLIGNVSEILATRKNHRLGADIYTFLCRIRSPKSTTILELKFFKQTHSWYVSQPGS